MCALMETLDVDTIKKDLIRYALKTESFYAFPVSYNISLLNKVLSLGVKPEVYDFIKTIQLNLSMKKE